MAGRPFVVQWQESADELFARYRAELDGKRKVRWHALWLLETGVTLAETARLVGVAYRTVQTWVAWYRAGGLAEVAGHRHGGNQRVFVELLSPEQEAALLAQATEKGFVSQAAARQWVKEQWGIPLTRHQMDRLFRKLRLRRKVPRPRSNRADLEAQAAWKKGAFKLTWLPPRLGIASTSGLPMNSGSGFTVKSGVAGRRVG
jgi:transposase